MRATQTLAIAVAGVLLAGCATTMPSVTDIRIDGSTRYQTVHHFGASAAWWAQAVGTWPAGTINEIMDLLYDRGAGLGLDVIRYNLGGGSIGMHTPDPLRTVETPESAPGVFDWSRDAASLSIIDAAVARGADVVLFANSPPARLTVTGAASGNYAFSNLMPGAERDFAAYLVSAAEELHSLRGWPITDISPVNEPQWDWGPDNGQEGSHYTTDEVAAIVAALLDEIERRDVAIDVSAPESGEMRVTNNRGLLAALFGPGGAGKRLDHYAVHSYWSDAIDRRSLRDFVDANYPGVELWMTEWTEMAGGRDVGMDSALVLARTVHEDMTITNAASWSYWIAVSPYDYHDGLIYIDRGTRTFEPTKRLWTLGQWTRYLDREAVRIDTVINGSPSSDDADGLLVSAFENPDSSRVAVLVNKGAPRAVSVTSDGYHIARIAVTSAESDLAERPLGTSTTVMLAAMSITTIQMER